MEEIVRINLDNEMDLILAHKRTMKLAELCGLVISAQTRFATAVSEIARCSIANGENSCLVLGIKFLNGGKKEIGAVILDKVNLEESNPEAYAYASRLARDIVKKYSNGVYEISLSLKIPYSGIISPARISSFIEYFKKETSLSPYDEIRKKNIQLIELSEKLSDSEAKYRQLTDTLPLLVFSVAATGAVTLTNKKMKDVLGSGFSHFTQTSIAALFHPDDVAVIGNAWDSVKRRGSGFSGQARVNIKDEYLWHIVSIVPDNNEDVSGYIVSMVNIHAQKLIEETLKDNKALRQAQESLKSTNAELYKKNKELEQFAYIASHDLQEPLRKIRNFTSLAERNLSEEEKEKLYFNKINSSAERMSRLITDVLNYSKLSVDDRSFSAVDLNVVLNEVIGDFEFQIEEKNAAITIAELPFIQGIPIQLSQLFYNLIGNSLKFVEGKPEVVVNYEKVEKNKHLYHKVSVIDNGIGIEEKHLSKIFTIFKRLHHQSEYEGTGIGLALCEKIIENHHGSIEISSIPNQGTTVDVYLPV
ncbi:PAS domain-containing sensor histidine kinase [Flavobacterium suzhouense]|uniref:histidine kinase n=1 Tax=Flavobacterium suzhouense TaxID=1529638 RepID=A0ABW5NYQ3_9FLAO